MKSYFSSLILCLLFAAGLLFPGPLQAGQNPVPSPVFQQDSLHAAVAPKPAPEKKTLKWPAIAAMIATGAEVLLTALATALFATTVGFWIWLVGISLSLAAGCFAIIYGLILRRRAGGGRNEETTVLQKLSDGTQVLLQRPGDKIEPDPELRKKARNTLIWGLAATVPFLVLIVYAIANFEI